MPVNIDRPDWQVQAICRTLDVNLFFPGPGQTGIAQAAEAKSHCRQCPVQHDCLNYALTYPERALRGIWGGTTERERSRMRRTEPTIDHFAVAMVYVDGKYRQMK